MLRPENEGLALASLLASLLLGCAGTTSTSSCPDLAPAQTESIRVVPQYGVGDATYFKLTPGNRYAVFSNGAIDLWNSRVAWIRAWSTWRTPTARDVVAIDAPSELGVQLLNLATGTGPEFLGDRLPHHALTPPFVALRRPSEVVLVDTLGAREVLKLPLTRRAISLVEGADRWYVLTEFDTTSSTGEQSFAIVTFDRSSGVPIGEMVPLTLPPLDPEFSGMRRSEPFLSFDDARGVQLSVATGCPLCRGSEASPLQWYRRGLSATDRWQVVTVSIDDHDALARLPREFVPPPNVLPPPEVSAAVERLPSASLGLLEGSHGVEFTTGDAARSCGWSLSEARRLECRPARQILRSKSVHEASCDLRVGADDSDATLGAIVITCDGKRIATAYDLGPETWALVLPDGRFTSSPDAPEYLAFYRSDGSILSVDEMRRQRAAPEELARTLTRALQRQPGCSPR